MRFYTSCFSKHKKPSLKRQRGRNRHFSFFTHRKISTGADQRSNSSAGFQIYELSREQENMCVTWSVKLALILNLVNSTPYVSSTSDSGWNFGLIQRLYYRFKVHSNPHFITLELSLTSMGILTAFWSGGGYSAYSMFHD